MSATEHERAASDADTAAIEHEAQYDANSTVFGGPDCSEFCFQPNPTEHHRAQAQRLRREAARHRDESYELRVAEERACVGIPTLHRDISPFFHREDIVGVESPDGGPAIVHFGKIPKTDAAQFQSLINCHLARNAVLGFHADHMEFCPLALPEVRATVQVSEQGFDVRLEADDPDVREKLDARVRGLGETP